MADETHVEKDFEEGFVVHDIEDFDVDGAFGSDDGKAEVEGDGFEAVFLDDALEVLGGGAEFYVFDFGEGD